MLADVEGEMEEAVGCVVLTGFCLTQELGIAGALRLEGTLEIEW